MLVLAVVLAALLVVGILLAPLGVGIVVVVVVLAVAVSGWVLWGFAWRRSRLRVRYDLERPELLGPGGADDPDRAEPAANTETQSSASASRSG